MKVQQGNDSNVNGAAEETAHQKNAALAAVESTPDTQLETLTEGECASISE